MSKPGLASGAIPFAAASSLKGRWFCGMASVASLVQFTLPLHRARTLYPGLKHRGLTAARPATGSR
jgi:hypothetical protein